MRLGPVATPHAQASPSAGNAPADRPTLSAATAMSRTATTSSLADLFGAQTGPALHYVRAGGQMLLQFAAAGLLTGSDRLAGSRVPMAPNGAPDFDAIIAAGGTVKGALPGGYAGSVSSGPGRVVMTYAAQIDLGDGSPPFYVKGGSATSGPDSTEAQRLDTIKALTAYVTSLPDTYEEARQRFFLDHARAASSGQRSVNILS